MGCVVCAHTVTGRDTDHRHRTTSVHRHTQKHTHTHIHTHTHTHRHTNSDMEKGGREGGRDECIHALHHTGCCQS